MQVIEQKLLALLDQLLYSDCLLAPVEMRLSIFKGCAKDPQLDNSPCYELIDICVSTVVDISLHEFLSHMLPDSKYLQAHLSACFKLFFISRVK